METATVLAIKTQLDTIRQSLDSFKDYHKAQDTDMNACNYGSESEFSINGIIGGVKNILIDLAYLTRAHNQFVKMSSYSERNEIKQTLLSLNNSLTNRRANDIIAHLDNLKSRLRSYNLRCDKDRLLEFSNALDEVCRKAIDLENGIQDVAKKLEEAESTYTKIEGKQNEYNEIIDELTSKKDGFVEEYNNFVSEVNDFKTLAERAKANESIISDHLKSAGEDKETFDDFISKIDDREKVLEKQDVATKAYEKKLEEFDKDQQKKLSEVASLIEKARQALQYTTAAGMSAAFQEQYDKTNNKWAKRWWLIFAVIFLAITIFIGA